MDPFNNCIHLACTEIRAENLSGECNMMRELTQGRIKTFPGHGQECVKRRAGLSLQANPKCRENKEEYIDAAMERCFADTFPFDRHPNQR
jgi:mitochondrial inner membrane protease ATP23